MGPEVDFAYIVILKNSGVACTQNGVNKVVFCRALDRHLESNVLRHDLTSIQWGMRFQNAGSCPQLVLALYFPAKGDEKKNTEISLHQSFAHVNHLDSRNSKSPEILSRCPVYFCGLREGRQFSKKMES